MRNVFSAGEKALRPGLIKDPWSSSEDACLEELMTLVDSNAADWRAISQYIPGRNAKQCRERWQNHLDPSLNKSPYMVFEDAVIVDLQSRLGNKWSVIRKHLPGRTEDSVKLRWKSLHENVRKRPELERAWDQVRAWWWQLPADYSEGLK